MILKNVTIIYLQSYRLIVQSEQFKCNENKINDFSSELNKIELLLEDSLYIVL